MVLGAVADDFTGATDLASMLVRGGLQTELQLGRPAPEAAPSQAEAVVVALKSRTAPVAEAVQESVASWRWLAAAGATRCYFKYCSTFDSTPNCCRFVVVEVDFVPLLKKSKNSLQTGFVNDLVGHRFHL